MTTRIASLCFILLGLSTIAPALAQESEAGMDAAVRLEAGDRIPAEFVAVDSLNRPVTFDAISGKEGLVLLFTRSADWCQYCKTQLREWNEHLELFKAEGYNVAAISYDSPALLNSFAEASDIGYTLLSDTDSRMIKAFGIRNTKFSEGSRFYGIPNPAIYVIDASREITHVFREENYKERPSVKEVLEAVGGKMPPAPEAQTAE